VGISTESAREKMSSQEPGLRESMTSPRFGILADEDFPRSEAEIRRQTDSLAAAVLEKLGNFAHGSPPLGISSASGA
jgi:hypothetical protein